MLKFNVVLKIKSTIIYRNNLFPLNNISKKSLFYYDYYV